MAKLMNPPQKRTYTPAKKKREPFDFQKHKKLIILVSVLLLTAIALSVGLGIFLNWYFVDTKYDSPFFKSSISVPDINSLSISKKSVDQNFDKELRAFIRSYATFKPATSGVVEESDNVTIDGQGFFVTNGTVDTQPYSGSKLDDYEITDIGNHYTDAGKPFFPEIQNAIIGQSVKEGTKTTAEIKYADDYSVEELKGKTLRFEITIISVTKTVSPEYNDDFIREKTGYDPDPEKNQGFGSTAEYEKALRDMVTRELVWSKVVSETEIKKYPKKFISQYSEEFDSYYKNKMQEDNLSFTQLLSSLGLKDEAAYNDAMLDYAQDVVKEEMTIYRIAKNEKLRVSRKEYNTELENLTANYNTGKSKSEQLSKKEFEELYGKDNINRSISWNKVKEHLRKLATVAEE